ncbi:GTP-binding protein [Chamaesiphon minutus]|uniref:Small GTP-binding protein domain protein n=1 Tax=Chamaesiphon minutus (strain ATCC 27169 / PCC 6605) TaxID=1173020 RepID=K9UKN7_CHAP6|nr:GTP-binding protein [Chamaesiphon minutus]AFY94754.1 small GTP-binding protein domain protein [Chamaesiphon minutus PCC 6605]
MMNQFPEDSVNLTDTIAEFNTIQAERNYQQAQDTLRRILVELDLTQRERFGLESEIAELSDMLRKLDRAVFQVAAFGMVGRGKSSLLNALIGQTVFEAGVLHGVTKERQQVVWEVDNWQDEFDLDKDTPATLQEAIEFIDTPGIDEVDGNKRQLLAYDIARQVDLILFIIAGDITELELQTLSQLRTAGKPMLLVFNKVDLFPDRDKLAIYAKIRDERVREILSPSEIMLVAAAPQVVRAEPRADGSMGVSYHPGTPQIAELKWRIVEILQREGKSLAALNAMLAADRIQKQVIDRKMDSRDEAANDIIWQSVMTKAIAVAINPIIAADLIGGAAIDIAMIIRLSKFYGISMTRSGALKLLQSIAMGMGGITISESIAKLGLSGIKGLMGIFAPATGGITIAPYTAIALTQAGIAGVSTYAIGQVTKTYLANGASWGEDSPKSVIARILATIDEHSIVDRIKQELGFRL